jgi:hypothetical protein
MKMPQIRKRRVLVSCFLIGLGVAAALFWKPVKPVPFGAPTATPAGDGWMDLLDEDHAPLWKNTTDDKEIFELQDGILHIFGKTVRPLRYVGYMGESFSHFEVHLEFKLAAGANSGLFLRAKPNDPVYRGFEVQILEDFGEAPSKNGSGAIYDVVTPMFNMARPAGEWNSYDIRVQEHEVAVTMNGWLVVHADFLKMTMPIGKFKTPFAKLPPEGLIQLQDHGGEVWFRNLRLKKL